MAADDLCLDYWIALFAYKHFYNGYESLRNGVRVRKDVHKS